jgi:hypothetical protein
LNWKGAYDSATAYSTNDAVTFNGSSYRAIQEIAANTANSDPNNTAYWTIIAQKGDTGQQGLTTVVSDGTTITGEGTTARPLQLSTGVLYAGSSSQGGPATSALSAGQSNDALALGGVPPSGYAPASGSPNYVSKAGAETITGAKSFTAFQSFTSSVGVGQHGPSSTTLLNVGGNTGVVAGTFINNHNTSGNDALLAVHTGPGIAVHAQNTQAGGRAGLFEAFHPLNSAPTLEALGQGSGPAFKASNNNTGPAAIFTSGNVGIGTSAPLEMFHVVNPGRTAGRFDGNVTVNGNLTVSGSSNISFTVNHDATLSGNGSAGSPLSVVSAPNGVVTTASYDDPSWITALDGRKIRGIITATSIFGRTNSNGAVVFGGNDGVGPGVQGFSPGGYGVAGYTSSNVSAGVYGSNPLGDAGRFDGNVVVSGDVGIGTTAPLAKLEIKGTGTNLLRLQPNGDEEDNHLIFGAAALDHNRAMIIATGNQGDAFGDLRFVTNLVNGPPVTAMTLRASGNVGIGTTEPGATLEVKEGGTTLADAWTTRSSARFKINIEPIIAPLDKALQLRGVTFNWKDTRQPSIGFIAEEVAHVLPEAVEYDADGKTTRGLDYSKVTPLLVEAIKAQQQEIEGLRRENAGLRTRTARQEARLTALEGIVKAKIRSVSTKARRKARR